MPRPVSIKSVIVWSSALEVAFAGIAFVAVLGAIFIGWRIYKEYRDEN